MIGGTTPVNDAVRVPTEGLLTTADLAARPDFTLGLAVVSPSSRTIAGPGGTAVIEPRVMQVLVVLADAAGQVVARETLFQRCWGGVYVGDDSLNRAIGGIRKLAAEVAGGSFDIETIPRTGYRLRGECRDVLASNAPAADLVRSRSISRRSLIGGGVAVAALAGIGTWAAINSREDAQFSAMLDDSYARILKQTADEKTVRLLEQAVASRPGSARAWGLLALLTASLAGGSDESARLVSQSEEAARRALSLDPREPNALLAMFELQGATLDWFTRDRRLRQIIAIDPDKLPAIVELAFLTAGTGLAHESWHWNERALALAPLSSDLLSRRALKLWIAGRTSDADKVIDQVRALDPQSPWAWWVRFFILALSGRPQAAQTMLDAEPRMIGGPARARLWQDALPALERPSAATIARARSGCIEGSRVEGFIANEAALIMCALGDVDTAFDIADGLFFSRGSIVRRAQAGPRGAAAEAGWRIITQWMWTPPAAVMRSDRRFLPLCDGVGLVDYWRRRGVRPDFKLAGS